MVEFDTQLSLILFLAAIISALAYSFTQLQKPESPARTFAKTVPVTLLALSAIANEFSWLLIAALFLSAAGDAFLAKKGQQRFILGLASFLIAHLVYSWMFLTMPYLIFPLWQIAIIAVLVIALIAMVLRHLWPHLGEMKVPVVAYTAAIALMAISGFALDIAKQLMIGIALFVVSDIVLSHETFVLAENDEKRKITGRIIWYCYFFGQALILATFLFPRYA